MRKRRLLFLGSLCFVVVMVALLVSGAFREREPEYGGRRLSEWVEKMYPASQAFNPDLASEPIRHIGTNAVPFLLEWIAYDPPIWRTKLRRARDEVSRRISRLFGRTPHGFINPDRKEMLAGGAVLSFEILGEQAGEAIRDLGRLANGPKQGKGGVRAASALRRLGQAGITPLITVLTNEEAAEVRRTVLRSIRAMGPRAYQFVPALLCLYTNIDWQTRSEATAAVQAIFYPDQFAH